MHHQVQQFGNFGLERLGFGGSGGRGHAGSIKNEGVEKALI
jgi:hypothetical protein